MASVAKCLWTAGYPAPCMLFCDTHDTSAVELDPPGASTLICVSDLLSMLRLLFPCRPQRNPTLGTHHNIKAGTAARLISHTMPPPPSVMQAGAPEQTTFQKREQLAAALDIYAAEKHIQADAWPSLGLQLRWGELLRART